VNVVGLQRAGLDRAAIVAVRRAYRTLFFGRPNLRQARERFLRELAATGGPSPEVAELLAFIDGARRGVCSAEPLARRRGQDESAED
jgi:UDP-N-acetylglucosamine acyltransferase